MTYPASINGQTKNITISEVSGTGGMYHVYIDKFYFGQIQRTATGWMQTIRELEGDDVDAILEVVDREFTPL